MSSITIATTEKNKPLLLFKGFNYTIDRINDKKHIGNVGILELLNAKEEYIQILILLQF
jgi:hypothetical protein